VQDVGAAAENKGLRRVEASLETQARLAKARLDPRIRHSQPVIIRIVGYFSRRPTTVPAVGMPQPTNLGLGSSISPGAPPAFICEPLSRLHRSFQKLFVAANADLAVIDSIRSIEDWRYASRLGIDPFVKFFPVRRRQLAAVIPSTKPIFFRSWLPAPFAPSRRVRYSASRQIRRACFRPERNRASRAAVSSPGCQESSRFRCAAFL
jgi:hypothetical protein